MSTFIKVRLLDRPRPALGPRQRFLVNDHCYRLLSARGILSPENSAAFDQLFDVLIACFPPSTPVQLSRLGALAVALFSRPFRRPFPHNANFPNEPNPVFGHLPAPSRAPNTNLPNEPNPDFEHRPGAPRRLTMPREVR
jgi:hypothetical protein